MKQRKKRKKESKVKQKYIRNTSYIKEQLQQQRNSKKNKQQQQQKLQEKKKKPIEPQKAKVDEVYKENKKCDLKKFSKA